MENVNDVVCLSFLSNEGDTDIFTTMKMIQFNLHLFFCDRKYFHCGLKNYHNLKHQVTDNLSLDFFFDVMNKNHSTVPVLTTKTMVISMEIFLVYMGFFFQCGGIMIVLIKSPFNQMHTQK